MVCNFCTQFNQQIHSSKHFQPEWGSDGCMRLQLDAARGHAESEQHKRAADLFLKGEGYDISERSSMSKKCNENQAVITDMLRKMSEDEMSALMKKIDVAYFVVKQEMSFTKYKELLKLEERHGVQLGNAYRLDDACKMFVRSVNESMVDELKVKLSNAKFIGVMADGSTDSAVKDQEAIFVIYFDPSPLNEDRVKVVTEFLGIINVKSGDASGILDGIKQAFTNINADLEEIGSKFVSFGADGASVNRGEISGVLSLLLEEHPWLIFMWCISHRIELSVKHGLRDTCFTHVDEMLLALYLLYYKSPKKLRGLKDFADLYAESLEKSPSGTIRPKKSCGTRWIAHKWNAMRNALDNYGIYIQHLKAMSEDESYKSSDRNKFIGYLRKWQNAKTPLCLALFIELLSPLRILSLAFQDVEVDIVNTAANIKKTKRMLQK